MIITNELRIGSWVKDSKSRTDSQILMIGYNNVDHGQGLVYFSEIEPIPLTSEWLERFGFEKLPNPNFMAIGTSPKFSDYFSIDLRGNYIEFGYKLINIKHVHQLQNLYFALTSKEL